MRIYTLGFSHKSAEEFFDILRESGVRRVVDIRRSNTNQLAGFTKKDDLRYFLRVILTCRTRTSSLSRRQRI